jgi:hypothetical protein
MSEMEVAEMIEEHIDYYVYTELGFPALKKGGHDKNLVGYFVADTSSGL